MMFGEVKDMLQRQEAVLGAKLDRLTSLQEKLSGMSKTETQTFVHWAEDDPIQSDRSNSQLRRTSTASDAQSPRRVSSGRRVSGDVLESFEIKSKKLERSQSAASGFGGHKLALSMATLNEPSRSTFRNDVDEDGNTLTMRRILGSNRFEMAMQVLILANVVSMTVRVSVAQCASSTTLFALSMVEFSFLVCYSTEMLLKIVVFQVRLFWADNAMWTGLDMIVVGCGWVHFVFLVLEVWPSTATFARVVRLGRTLRVARLWKTLRHAFPITHLVLSFLGNLVHTLLLSALLSVAVSYMFMIAIMELVVQYLLDDPDPEVQNALERDWGSPPRVLLSLYLSVTGGVEWDVLAQSLWDADALSYAIVVVFIAFFQFVMLNIVTFCFTCAALRYQEMHRTVDWRLSLVDAYVAKFHSVFGEHVYSITFEDFCTVLEAGNPTILDLIAELGVTPNDVEQVLFSLSRQATVDVHFDKLTVACIKMKDPATRADLLQLTDTVEVVQTHLAEERDSAVFIGHNATLSSSTSMPLEVSRVTEADFIRKLTNSHLTSRLQTAEDQQQFRRTVTELVKITSDLDGGCGFVVSPLAALMAIQRDRVDFQVTDKRNDFPKGYMTQRLEDVDVADPLFHEAIRDFSAHSHNDRWPDDHEAHGLPKDGYMLLTHRGNRVKCAAKIVGLPTSPYRWDGVGTRHTTALGLCWALRFFPAVILVKSDGGQVHGLHFNQGKVIALECVRVMEAPGPMNSLSPWVKKSHVSFH